MRSGGGEVVVGLVGTGTGACWAGGLTRRGRRASRAAVCAAALLAADCPGGTGALRDTVTQQADLSTLPRELADKPRRN